VLQPRSKSRVSPGITGGRSCTGSPSTHTPDRPPPGWSPGRTPRTADQCSSRRRTCATTSTGRGSSGSDSPPAARGVPGDLAAAGRVHHRGAVSGRRCRRAAPGGVDRRVLQQQTGVRNLVPRTGRRAPGAGSCMPPGSRPGPGRTPGERAQVTHGGLLLSRLLHLRHCTTTRTGSRAVGGGSNPRQGGEVHPFRRMWGAGM